jgi:hypothetical protein
VKCDNNPSYSSCLSTVHKTRVVVGDDTTITVDEMFLILEMPHFQSGVFLDNGRVGRTVG